MPSFFWKEHDVFMVDAGEVGDADMEALEKAHDIRGDGVPGSPIEARPQPFGTGPGSLIRSIPSKAFLLAAMPKPATIPGPSTRRAKA
jgi:hypothetical protein